jgi:hypothetical protein
MDANEDIFARIMDDPEFRTIVADWMLRRVYHRLNTPSEAT